MEDEPELDAGGMRNSNGAGFAAFGKIVNGMDVTKKNSSVSSRCTDVKPKDFDLFN